MTLATSQNQARESWQQEMGAAHLYRQIARQETNAEFKKLFMQLASESEKQAEIWKQTFKVAGPDAPANYVPDPRTKLISWLIRRFGARRIKPILAASKIRGMSVFAGDRSHGYHPMPQSLEDIGVSHKGMSNSGGLRAAVFGVNDGLVSIACLIMGVAGATSENGMILLSGLAGLLAGAFSMAAGEYISMRSQREMFEYQISLEQAELVQYPQQEAEELALIYMARGMPQAEARSQAQRMIANPGLGLDTLAREELGLNPDALGSPWLAAIASFLAFSAGGLVPLLPYLLGAASAALMLSAVLSTTALFAVGALLSLFSGRSAMRGGLRMLLIGASAGMLTYVIGVFLGVNLA